MSAQECRSLERLVSLRARLFACIEKALAEDDHCKSYEGTFEVVMPCYFGGDWVIRLHCYVVGPSRHYEWRGSTIEEAELKAEVDITSWCERWDAREQANKGLTDASVSWDK